ncbi:MAG TPA: hypothetical protein VGN35_10730 [Jatrophihabitantaceae bacterium]|nr:hypothetical protein [Jatrophihabitantaceae bacterium]
MAAFVIALVLTNVATLVALVVVSRRHRSCSDEPVDERVSEVLASSIRPLGPPSASAGRARRVISVEILNPIELAGVRGRVFGIAGSLVPHLTRRIVYDQTVRQLREQLAAHQVVADVRVHVLPPERSDSAHAAEPIRLDVTVDEPDEFQPDRAYEPPVQ